MEKIRVLLVDDQRLFLESLKLVLENQNEDIQVIGTALNGEEALEAAETLKPQVILMDVRMPVMDGVAAVRIIKQRLPETKIIMLTTFEDDDYVQEAMKGGAEGYMLKNIDPPMLVSGIKAVLAGSILISPSVAGNLIERVYKSPKEAEKKLDKALPHWYVELSSREKSILRCMLKNMSNKEIAAHIHVGDQTIRNYISTIYSKMDAPGRREAMEMARGIPEYFYD